MAIGLVTPTLRWVGCVLALILLSACANTGKHPPAPASAATPDYNYLVGPGDTLNIIVWRNPELSLTVPVRPDGKFSTPLIDDVVAQGRPSAAIAREIESRLQKYVRDPVVTVVVSTFLGPYDQQIRVVGEAAKPQSLPFRQNMTVLDVMIAVGGLTDFADGNAASIVRASDGGKQYSVRLRDLIRYGDVSANVEMRPGDILIIPQGFF
jgi:polysaccharide export outer membrane protein